MKDRTTFHGLPHSFLGTTSLSTQVYVRMTETLRSGKEGYADETCACTDCATRIEVSSRYQQIPRVLQGRVDLEGAERPIALSGSGLGFLCSDSSRLKSDPDSSQDARSYLDIHATRVTSLDALLKCGFGKGCEYRFMVYRLGYKLLTGLCDLLKVEWIN
ncbi:hypothetical protein CRG98_012383 [Punica granatum]|uniref:Uncharacterized protein n=1 Tax=Punica granatum TaxID=22663 RepID=A0A2I0KFG5_PUNGR|nr:hypothetical protein CRG98_012383 [Punica granatum]